MSVGKEHFYKKKSLDVLHMLPLFTIMALTSMAMLMTHNLDALAKSDGRLLTKYICRTSVVGC